MSFLHHDESIKGTDKKIVDFWRWAYSNILTNTNRSCFAEFLVGSALNVIDKPRIEWDACDLIYKGLKIEVKSSAYVQSWEQKKTSKIVLDISRKMPWEAATNTYHKDNFRYSDIFIFCVLTTKEKDKVDVLDISQWSFYLVPVKYINDNHFEQKSLSLSKIEKIFKSFSYNEIKNEVDSFLSTFNYKDVLNP